MYKPMLACDAKFEKISYPVIGMPKIDGVRGLVQDGQLLARSGKPFRNELNDKFFSDPRLNGFDGELTMGLDPTADNLCSNTTSAMMNTRADGECVLWVFDYCDPSNESHDGPYHRRLEVANYHVVRIVQSHSEFEGRVKRVPWVSLDDEEDLREYMAKNLEDGYEGTILRDPYGIYKHGRCTQNEANYMRVKAFDDAEIVVTRVSEGHTNTNTKGMDPHGNAERSSSLAGMIPNGRIGSLHGTLCADMLVGGKVFLEAGAEVTVSPGKLSVEERELLFNNQAWIIGRIAKFKYFPIGMKDKPRFPTFQSFRDPLDMG